jgi:hypothetical protein
MQKIQRGGRIDSAHATCSQRQRALHGYVGGRAQADEHTVRWVVGTDLLNDIIEVIEPGSVEHDSMLTALRLWRLSISTQVEPNTA